MASLDKAAAVGFCPLCGTAKEKDVYAGGTEAQLIPQFYCGTIIRPFEEIVHQQGDNCRLIQKMRIKPVEQEAFAVNKL